MTHSVFRSTVLAAAVVAAGFGCTNIDASGVAPDPSAGPESSVVAVPSALATVAPVIELGVDRDHRAPLVVLDASPDDAAGTGVAAVWRDPSEPSTLYARKPFALAGIEGVRVRLSTADGAVCVGVLGAPFVFGRVSTMDDEDPRDATKHADDAEESAWTRTRDGRSLVAEVGGNDCLRRNESPAWTVAMLADSAPRSIETTAADASTTSTLLARFRALPEWTEIAERRREWDGDMKLAPVASWDEADPARPDVVVASIDGARFAWVSAATYGGCGDFDGALTVLFEEHDGAWTARDVSHSTLGTPTKAWKSPRGIAFTFADGSVARLAEAVDFVTPSFGFEGCGC